MCKLSLRQELYTYISTLNNELECLGLGAHRVTASIPLTSYLIIYSSLKVLHILEGTPEGSHRSRHTILKPPKRNHQTHPAQQISPKPSFFSPVAAPRLTKKKLARQLSSRDRPGTTTGCGGCSEPAVRRWGGASCEALGCSYPAQRCSRSTECPGETGCCSPAAGQNARRSGA